jgi:3-methyladenine DNA glycosylase AlkD
MSTIEEVLMELHRLADPEVVTFKAKKYNVTADHSLGVYQKDLNAIAKVIGKNNDLALALYDTGIYEARILCSKLYQSKDLTEAQMECWVADFENWEICDAFCMKFFCGSPWVDEKLLAWTERAETFVKRAGFVMMATYSSTYKKAGNEAFEAFLPIIEREAHDERIYVKKAVNWALREIGKRNIDLYQSANTFAERLEKRKEKSAKWIAKDALREFRKPNLAIRGYPRGQYERMRLNSES